MPRCVADGSAVMLLQTLPTIALRLPTHNTGPGSNSPSAAFQQRYASGTQLSDSNSTHAPTFSSAQQTPWGPFGPNDAQLTAGEASERLEALMQVG